jgi:hypothetical protein
MNSTSAHDNRSHHHIGVDLLRVFLSCDFGADETLDKEQPKGAEQDGVKFCERRAE